MPASTSRSVLVSGASIAGPILAYWLSRAGCEVTVVERASTLRAGGYPIDIRGAAVHVARRMGIDAQLQDLHVDTQTITFVDGRGRTTRSLKTSTFAGQQVSDDLEVPRGGLTQVLYDRTRDDVEYRFDDSIADMQHDTAGVDVTFSDGRQHRFGIVLGADGIHSTVRKLAFGPEATFDRYLGWCFVVFTAPNRANRANECVVYNTPGRVAAIYAVGDRPHVHVLLGFMGPKPTDTELHDVGKMRRLTRSAFSGAGWEIPTLLADLESAPDTFCDSISQIHMPRWSSGRVGVVGDAAFAPSFLSGQGTSTAMVGAYVLAGELTRTSDYALAFTRYERLLRPYIARNQALAKGGGALTIDSGLKLFARNQMLRVLPLLGQLGITSKLGGNIRRASNAVTLPDYHLANARYQSTETGGHTERDPHADA